MTNLHHFRRVLWTGAGCLIGTTVVLLVLVIPAFTMDAYPLATPRPAMIATSVIAVVTLAAAAALASVGYRRQWTGVSWRVTTALLGLPLLLFALALLDGAFAMWGHGSEMRLASVAMFGAAAAELVAAVSAVTAACLRVAAEIPPPAGAH